MTNEEFQRLVLEKLDRQDERFDRLEARLDGIEARLDRQDERFGSLETRLDGIEARLDSMEKKLDSINEQTAILSEFKTETLERLDRLEINISRVEIATADNWGDLARLKAAR